MAGRKKGSTNLGNYCWSTVTCPICGKKFTADHIEENWAYKRRLPEYTGHRDHYIFMCSWKCLRIFDEQRRIEKDAKQEESRRAREAKRNNRKGA